MDPEATYAILEDEGRYTSERDFAALDLLVWLARDGAPLGVNFVGGLRPKADLISRCEARLTSALESEDR